MPGGGINSFGSQQSSGKNCAKAHEQELKLFCAPHILPGDFDQHVWQNKSYFSAQNRLKLIDRGLICVCEVTKIATKQTSRFGVLYISGMEIQMC